jgi:CRP/FNR family transcriptional regulator
MHTGAGRRLVVAGHEREPCAHCDVRQRSVCGAILEEDLAQLAAVAEIRDYDRGKVFIEEGERAQYFYNVTRGTAKLFKLLPDGRQQVTGFAAIGHFLGLAVVDTYAFSAEAIEPVRVCRFTRNKLHALIVEFPALEERLLATACSELVAAQEQMLLLGRKTALERVASFLLSWGAASGMCDEHCNRLKLPMTRSEIADHLGLTIETVSRTLSRMRAQGRIATPSNTEILILDRPWLEELAAGTMLPA